MMRLIARKPILHLSRQYMPGDELPTSDTTMMQAWIDAETAFWKDDEEATKPKKAKMVTAMPGVSGISTTGNEEDLAGRIPDSPEREKPKPKRRTAAKKE